MKLKFTALVAAGLLIAPTSLYAQAAAKDTLRPKTKDSLTSKTRDSLPALTVKGRKPLVEQQLDRTVIHPDALITTAGTTVLDMLDRLPGVTVDPGGTIQLQGKSSVKIFIDDKPVYLSGSDLAAYLRSLPSSQIDRIELMPNPPARYDASGNGGVINIRMKRIRDKGFNGNLNPAFIQGVYARSNDNLTLNYRNNKLNVAASLGYNRNNNFNNITLNRYFDPGITSISPVFRQSSVIRRQSDSYNGRVGIDYYATRKTTFGIQLMGLANPSATHTASSSRLTKEQGTVDSIIIADNHDKTRFTNGGINLNYRHDYNKKDENLSIDLDYLTYHTHTDQRFINTSFYPDGTLYDSSLSTGNLPSVIHIYSANADHLLPLPGNLKINSGLKTSYTTTDNSAGYFDLAGQTILPDYDKTNHFLYKENINAAYLSLSKDIGRWSIQAGGRFENTIAHGHQLGNVQKPDSTFNRSYNGLFPTFYVQYLLDSAGKQRLNFNYGRRLERPYYAQLNPFVSPLDKFTFNTGNPFLLPTYSNNFQLSYTRANLTARLFYIYIHNKIDGLVRIDNGYYYSEPGNLGNTYVGGVEVDATLDPFSWLNIHLYGRFIDQHTVSAFYTGLLDTRGTQYFIRPILTIKPGKDWVLQIDGYYQSKLPTEQFIDADRKVVNAAVSKKLSDKATVRLAVNDLFYTMNVDWSIGHLAGSQADRHSVGDTRNAILSFTYRFGKAIAGGRKHNANGTQSEQERARG